MLINHVVLFVLSSRTLTEGNTTDEVLDLNLTALHWVVSGLEPGRQYVFHVAARNNLGWGAYSNASSLFTPLPGGELIRSKTQFIESKFDLLFLS